MSKKLINFATGLSNVFQNKRLHAYIIALLAILVTYGINITIQVKMGYPLYNPPIVNVVAQMVLFLFWLWKDERDAKKNSAEESLG